MSIALNAMFSLKKQFAKLCIISGFELKISCIPRGSADHCTTSVDADICLCMALVCLLGLGCIAGRTSPFGWCRTSGAGPAAPPAPAMASPAWAFRVTWIPRARTQKSGHSGSGARPLDSELELSLWPSVLAARPSAMRVRLQAHSF